MNWWLSDSADPAVRPLADRHYSRQKPGTARFVPPGRCFVLKTAAADAVWATSWPFAEYVRHDWPGAWICSIFRNEGKHLSSDLIREAVAATRWRWPEVPVLGMITFVDVEQTRRKRDPGRCFRRAGFIPAHRRDCPWRDGPLLVDCSCDTRTHGGLFALQLTPEAMPSAVAPSGVQEELQWTS